MATIESRVASMLTSKDVQQLLMELRTQCGECQGQLACKKEGILNLSPRIAPRQDVYHPLMPSGAEEGATTVYFSSESTVNARSREALSRFGSVVIDRLVTTFDGRILERQTSYSEPANLILLGPGGRHLQLKSVGRVATSYDREREVYTTIVEHARGSCTIYCDVAGNVTAVISN